MIKSKTFRAWLPGQSDLMPASPIEWLPSDSMMSFLLDLAVRVLTGNQQPDHSRISEFRQIGRAHV